MVFHYGDLYIRLSALGPTGGGECQDEELTAEIRDGLEDLSMFCHQRREYKSPYDWCQLGSHHIGAETVETVMGEGESSGRGETTPGRESLRITAATQLTFYWVLAGRGRP